MEGLSQESTPWSYIRRAPRSEVIGIVKGGLGVWLIFMIFSVGVVLIFSLGASIGEPNTSEVEVSLIPRWLFLTAACGCVLWFARKHGFESVRKRCLEFAHNARAISKADRKRVV